jgi:hypothetical protein
MLRHTMSQPARRGGKVIVLAALSMVAIVGSVALALDGGLLLEHKRQVQSAADVAALSAAADLYKNYPQNQGLDPANAAQDRALDSAKAQGFANGTTTSTVTVNIPPKSGNHVGAAGYAEVIVEYRQPRYFSAIFGSKPLPVSSRAVSRGKSASFGAGILVLDLVEAESLKANGGGTVSVANTDIIVNSKDPSATGGDGGGVVLQVTNGSFVLTGGVKSNTTLQGPVVWNQPPTPDPFAYLPEPTLPGGPITVKALQPNNPTASPYLDALGLQAKDVGKFYLLEPGRYDRLPNFTNGDVVIL